MTLNLASRRLSAAAFAASLSLACGPDKGGSDTGSTGDSTGASTDAPQCTPGDTKSGEGDCSTCECSAEGTWQCNRCNPTTGADVTTADSTSADSTTADSTTADTPSTSTGDGPMTTGDGSTGNDDTGGQALPNCPDLGESDMFAIDAAKVVGDELVLDVGYSGGCQTHEFTLCFAGIVLDTDFLLVRVHHDAMGDACEAFITEQRVLDLTPLQQFAASPVQFELDGWPGPLQYVY